MSCDCYFHRRFITPHKPYLIGEAAFSISNSKVNSIPGNEYVRKAVSTSVK